MIQKSPYILGIDVGTQSVKTGLLEADTGALGFMASRPYPSDAEQPPDAIWSAVLECAAETVSLCGNPRAVAAVGLSGQMHGTALYDAADKVIGNIINWQDERCNRPVAKFDGRTTIKRMLEIIPDDLADDLGIDRMASGFLGATLFNIKELDPDLFSRVRRVLTPTDFVRRNLCGGGAFATDPTNAFGTGVFNTRENRWHSEVLERLGLPIELFPEVFPTDHVIGHVSDFTARRTGLPNGIPVVVGGGDNQMAMLGAGAFDSNGPLCVNIGTSSQICAVIDEYKKIPGIDTRSFFNGNFALVYAGLTGGRCYTWLKNMLFADLAAVQASPMQGRDMFAVMDELAARVTPGAAGLRFEPLLRGTRRDPARRAAFTGIGMNNFTLGHRARAVMEGVVAELSGAFAAMNHAGAAFIAGAGNGLVRSPLWQRITADAFGLTLKVADFENAVYGAALTAAKGIGLMDFEDAKINYANTIEPDR